MTGTSKRTKRILHLSLVIAIATGATLNTHAPTIAPIALRDNQASAQYFIRRKTDEEKAAEQDQNKQAPEQGRRGFTIRPKNAPGSAATIEKRRINPLFAPKIPIKKEKSDTPEAPRPTMPTVQDIQNRIEPKAISMEMAKEIRQSMGACAEQDQQLLTTVGNALSQTAEQSALDAQAAAKENAYAALDVEQVRQTALHLQETGQLPANMPDNQFEAILKEFEETGEPPQALKDMIERRPKAIDNTFSILQENVDFENYLQASIKCMDFDNLYSQ